MTDYDAVLAEMPESDSRDPIEASGLAVLSVGADLLDVAAALRKLAPLLNNHDALDRRVQRDRAVQVLKAARISDASGLVDAALSGTGNGAAQPGQGQVVTLSDPEPWPEAVEGAALLTDLSGWFGRYIYLPSGAARATAVWVVATWFIREIYFAPILAILSATKRCGKTLLLELLKQVVRLGYATSGTGVTTAVVFRLNEDRHPTLLIDEAERLAGRHADRELISLLNTGYRRGARVQRCIERNGDYQIREFDAFGFRALAAIGTLWDTILDRAIVVRLERKSRAGELARFSGRVVEKEGAELARRIRRWTDDHHDAVAQAESQILRPAWLNDRECDNWACLFAVADVAGGDWLARIEESAKQLRADDDQDHGELLIHDIWAVFEAEGRPEIIRSAELVKKLNAIETSPWGDYRGGDGITTHKLAAILKPFDVKPEQRRSLGGEKLRGYWFHDLGGVFVRYPPPRVGQAGQAGQSSKKAGSEGFQSGTANTLCPTLESAETPVKMRDVPLVPLVPLQAGSYEEDERRALQEEGM